MHLLSGNGALTIGSAPTQYRAELRVDFQSSAGAVLGRLAKSLGAKVKDMEATAKTSGLKRKRRIFGMMFLASTLVFFASNMIWTMAPMSPPVQMSPPVVTAPPTGSPPWVSSQPPSHAPDSAAPDTAVVVSIVSLLTSLTSLVGFFSTTVLAWRKERRETVSAELEVKMKELELEKLKVELAKSKGSESSEST